ncbi:hypothetical protein AB0F46_42590 [Streptomyces sp. NPDC026665]|uniref:hypothetical protein n=1 Tax=Streptomyces sp. NPDC026665 TaxID=3154798 RepID=UPI0033C46E69
MPERLHASGRDQEWKLLEAVQEWLGANGNKVWGVSLHDLSNSTDTQRSYAAMAAMVRSGLLAPTGDSIERGEFFNQFDWRNRIGSTEAQQKLLADQVFEIRRDRIEEFKKWHVDTPADQQANVTTPSVSLARKGAVKRSARIFSNQEKEQLSQKIAASPVSPQPALNSTALYNAQPPASNGPDQAAPRSVPHNPSAASLKIPGTGSIKKNSSDPATPDSPDRSRPIHKPGGPRLPRTGPGKR